MSFCLEQYIPHRSSMKLIDQLTSVTDMIVVCKTTITETHVFYDEPIQGVHSWIGIELMAQTVAAFAGYQDDSNEEPAIGLLLSLRNFTCERAVFKLGETLSIKAHKEYLDDDIGVFSCEITSEDIEPEKIIASAKLNTTQPSAEKLKIILNGGR